MSSLKRSCSLNPQPPLILSVRIPMKRKGDKKIKKLVLCAFVILFFLNNIDVLDLDAGTSLPTGNAGRGYGCAQHAGNCPEIFRRRGIRLLCGAADEKKNGGKLRAERV